MPPFSFHWESFNSFTTHYSSKPTEFPPRLVYTSRFWSPKTAVYFLVHVVKTFKDKYCLPAPWPKGSSGAPSTSSELAVMWTFTSYMPHQVFAVILLSVKDHLQTKVSADLQIYPTLSHSSLELSKNSLLLSDCVLIAPSYSTDQLHMGIQCALLPLAIKNKLHFGLFPLVLGNQHL